MPVQQKSSTHLRVLLILTDRGIWHSRLIPFTAQRLLPFAYSLIEQFSIQIRRLLLQKKHGALPPEHPKHGPLHRPEHEVGQFGADEGQFS